MDARRFLGPRDATPPARREWSIVGIKMLIGAVMLFIGITLVNERSVHPPLVHVHRTGVARTLRLFQLIALIWQSNGVPADALMLKPAQSTSLGDLWGRRWNTAFNVLAPIMCSNQCGAAPMRSSR